MICASPNLILSLFYTIRANPKSRFSVMMRLTFVLILLNTKIAPTSTYCWVWLKGKVWMIGKQSSLQRPGALTESSCKLSLSLSQAKVPKMNTQRWQVDSHLEIFHGEPGKFLRPWRKFWSPANSAVNIAWRYKFLGSINSAPIMFTELNISPIIHNYEQITYKNNYCMM